MEAPPWEAPCVTTNLHEIGSLRLLRRDDDFFSSRTLILLLRGNIICQYCIALLTVFTTLVCHSLIICQYVGENSNPILICTVGLSPCHSVSSIMATKPFTSCYSVSSVMATKPLHLNMSQ